MELSAKMVVDRAIITIGVLVSLTVGSVALVATARESRPAVAPVVLHDVSVVQQFSSLAAPGIPVYLAVEPDGSVIFGDRAGPTVDHLSPDGQLLAKWGPLDGVAGVATHGNDIFALDPVRQLVVRMDSSGSVTGQISFSRAGTYGPGAIAVDPAENVYIADTGGNRILVYDLEGQLLKTIGSGGSGAGQLRQPMGISIAPNGALYAAEAENRRISWWDAAGTFGGSWATQFAPWSVSVDGIGRVFVPDPDTRAVHVYSPDGDEIAQLSEDASTLDFPSQAALTSDGATVWVLGHNGLVRIAVEALPQPTARPAPSLPVRELAQGLIGAAGVGVLAVLTWRASRWLPRAQALGAPFMLLSLALACAGQLEVTMNNSVAQARPLHLLALALAAAGALLLGREVTSIARPARESQRMQWPRARPRTGIAVGGVLMLLAVPLTVISAFEIARGVWLAGLAMLLAGAIASSWRGPRSISRQQWLVTGTLIGIIVVTFALRFFDLATLPPEVHGDEAAVGLQARKLLSGEVLNLFGIGWYELPMLSFALQVPTMWLLGNDLFGLRMGSVVQGTLSVLVTFLLARRLFNTRVGLVSAGLLAGAEMHIHYSRIGNTYIESALATALVLYLMLRAFETRRMSEYILLGIAGGLSLVVYAAARLALVLVALYVAHALVRDRRFLSGHVRGLVIAAWAGVVFLSPLLVTYVRDPAAFNVRMNEISIFSDLGSNHEFSAYGTTSYLDVIAVQTQHTLEAFNFTGESSQQYAHPAPLLDFWTGALLVVAVGAFAFRLRNPAFFLLATWLWLTLLLGAVFTVDAPFSPHLVGMLPVLAIYPALALELLFKFVERSAGAIVGPAMGALAVVFVGVAGYANIRDYLEVHVVKLQPAGMYTEMSQYMQQVENKDQIYFISRRDMSLDYDTINFLVPDNHGISLRDGPIVLQPTPPGKGLAFIVDPGLSDAAQRLQQLRQMFPSGVEQQHRSTVGNLLFTTYEVPG